MISSIARGWSPVGTYPADVLSSAIWVQPSRCPNSLPTAPTRRSSARSWPVSAPSAASRRRGSGRARSWPRIDLALLGLATFKASRTVARDKVTSFVREPFVEGEAYDGEDEQPTHETEMKQAIGELVTCTRCIGTWIGAGLASTQILAPRTGRLLTSVAGGRGASTTSCWRASAR